MLFLGTYLYSKRPINVSTNEYKYLQHNIVREMLYDELSMLSSPTKNKREWKFLLEDSLHFKHYHYSETDLPSPINGKSNKFLRTIVIDENINNITYVSTLTHEILHIKLFTSNETYVCYETFKFLYTNINEELRYAGIVYALGVFNGMYGDEYDITNQITHYFLEGVC